MAQELYPRATTIGPEAWVFAEHNATAAAADGVSRVDRVVRAHIGSNAILDCVVKKGSQFGMVSRSVGRSVTERGKEGSGSIVN